MTPFVVGPKFPGLDLQDKPRSHRQATVSLGGRRDRGDFAPLPPSADMASFPGSPVRGALEHVSGGVRTLLVVAGSTLYRVLADGVPAAVTTADGGPLVIGGSGPVQIVADGERAYILAP